MKLFIYHEKPDIVQFLYQTVKEYFETVRHTYQIFATWQLKESAEYLKQNVRNVDLFLMDFSRFESGKKMIQYIRQYNSAASWVYIGELKGLPDTLLYRPSAYLNTEMTKASVTDLIQQLDALFQCEQKENYFTFKYEKEFVRIPYDKITFFESQAKKVILHLIPNDKKYYFTAKLSDIETMLPDCFLRCHQSYLINMNQVKYLDQGDHIFMMQSQEEILISKRLYTNVKKTYETYMAESGITY